jgi:hypothetical protein
MFWNQSPDKLTTLHAMLEEEIKALDDAAELWLAQVHRLMMYCWLRSGH